VNVQFEGAHASASTPENGSAMIELRLTLAQRVDALEGHRNVLEGREAGREARLEEAEGRLDGTAEVIAGLQAEVAELRQALSDFRAWVGEPAEGQ